MKDATDTTPSTTAASGDEQETAMREELDRIEAVIHAVQYRHALMDAVLLIPTRSAAEAHLTSSTAMTGAQVGRVMNVTFGELTRDAREAMYLRQQELKHLLPRRRR